MNKVTLILKGVVSNFLNKETKDGVKYGIIQFLNMNNDKLEIIDVKVDENLIGEIEKKVKVGKEVELEVSVNTFNNKLYYKVVGV